MQRVSDELLARWENLQVRGDAPMREAESALPVVIMDLRDARAEIARLREQVERLTAEVGEQVALGRKWMERADALEPVARAAVRMLAACPIVGSGLARQQEEAVRSLDAAIGALPEEMRKELGG